MMTEIKMEMVEMNYLAIYMEGGEKHFYCMDIMTPAEALGLYAKTEFTNDLEEN